MALQHISVHGNPVVLVVACGVITVLGIVPRQLGLQWTGYCSTGVFVGVALASLPALRWQYHQYYTVVFTGVAPAPLPALHGHLCPCRAGLITRVAPALP
jgi:hypothetical protein